MKIVYLIGETEVDEILKRTQTESVRVVPVPCGDWERDLSPWKAEKVFRNGSDFSGGADAFSELLISKVMPEAESGGTDIQRYIAGYSLAGLFSVYAAVKTGLFDGFASMSGSMWFDGFCEYLEAQKLPDRLRTAYFSVGKSEKHTKNPRMREVEACTLRSADFMRESGIKTVFELNEGGHFDNVNERIIKGILAVTQ